MRPITINTERDLIDRSPRYMLRAAIIAGIITLAATAVLYARNAQAQMLNDDQLDYQNELLDDDESFERAQEMDNKLYCQQMEINEIKRQQGEYVPTLPYRYGVDCDSSSDIFGD